MCNGVNIKKILITDLMQTCLSSILKLRLQQLPLNMLQSDEVLL